MKISRRLKRRCILALAALLALPCAGLMRTQAAKGIDLNQECTLTVSADVGDTGMYMEDFNRMEIPVSAYRVADVDITGQRFTPVQAFSEMSFSKINEHPEEVSAADWQELSGQADEICKKASLTTDWTTTLVCTDEISGVAKGEITGLMPGLYLIAADAVYNPEYTAQYQFTPYLTALPSSQYTLEGAGSDEWMYEVTVGLKPEAVPQYGKLNITKILRNYNETLGRTTFVFHIVGTDRYGVTQYEEVESMTYTAAGSNTITLEHIPAGLNVTVTEVYSGASYTIEGSSSDTALVWSEAAINAGAAQEASVTFTNSYDGGNRGGYGVTNHFESDGNGGWTWENPTTPPGQ